MARMGKRGGKKLKLKGDMHNEKGVGKKGVGGLRKKY